MEIKRGGRMKIEKDHAIIRSGVRHGISLGSPISLWIENKDYSNWLAKQITHEKMFAQNKEDKKYFARKGDRINGKPLIVLINNGSASAAEIVAGALQDQKRAVVLGESSYGKGSVQSIIPLKNNGAIRLTVSKYYLPSGKSISEVGILPDIKVEEQDDEFSINTITDNQLNYAVKLFSG